MPRRHPRLAVLLAFVFAVLTATYMWLGFAPARATAVSKQFRLPALPGETLHADTSLSRAEIRQALHDAPIEQPVVNVALVHFVGSGSPSDATRAGWFRALSSLGWRDTTSLQNRIADAVAREDIDSVFDSADALMRRRVIFEQAVQLMTLAEANPGTRARVIQRIKARVGWRYDYLQHGGLITVPVVLDARQDTLMTLLQGEPLQPQEVRPFITAQIQAGRVVDADRVWRRYTKDHENAVHDPHFLRALVSLENVSPVPLVWNPGSGLGYSADIASNGLGRAIVSLHWDGRGVPIFLSQRISTPPGRYAIRLAVDGDVPAFAERVGVRLRCPTGDVTFTPSPKRQLSELVFLSDRNAPCSFPTLELFGLVGKTTRSFDGAFTTLRVDSTSAALADTAIKR